MRYNNIKIFQMTMEDFSNIKHILLHDFDDFWNVQTFEEELKNENSYYLVAKIDNTIIGFAGMKIILDEADIMNIATRKDSRNLGIGSIMLENLISIAKERGIKKLMLEVNEKNINAIHLYKKFNFEEISTRKKYYDNMYDAIIMQKFL